MVDDLKAVIKQQYMREMIHEGKERRHEERTGLLPMLISASELEEGAGLSDEELVGRFDFFSFSTMILYHCAGNIYIFLLAGHEVSLLSESSTTWTKTNRLDIFTYSVICDGLPRSLS